MVETRQFVSSEASIYHSDLETENNFKILSATTIQCGAKYPQHKPGGVGVNALFEILFLLHIMVKLHLEFNDFRSLATLQSPKEAIQLQRRKWFCRHLVFK